MNLPLRRLSPFVLLVTPACVTQERYDEALDSSLLYQRLYHDAEQHARELELENQTLKDQMGIVGTAESGMNFEDIDRRIEAVDSILDGLGRDHGDVSVFKVDGGFGFGVRDSVLFDSGRAELRPAGRELLSRLGAEIATGDYGFVWVRGHTDSDRVRQPATLKRFPHGNIDLSAARAVEVYALLTDQGGISEERMAVIGFGPSRPVAPNDTPMNKQKNRRVEIVVMDEAPSASSSTTGE